MIKGAQKKIVVVRTRESRFFEEAYFVMRRDIPPVCQENSDIVAEANRIVRQSTDRHRRHVIDSALFGASRISKLIAFGIGAFVGGGCATLLFVLMLSPFFAY